MTMGFQYTPDEAREARQQVDTAEEELSETIGRVIPGAAEAEAPAVVPDSPAASAAAPEAPPADAAPAAPQGWWARFTRGLRRRS